MVDQHKDGANRDGERYWREEQRISGRRYAADQTLGRPQLDRRRGGHECPR
jgi:hypothetical protein